MKKFIERNVDLKTWKGWIFLLLVVLIGIVIVMFIGFIYTEVDWAETYRNWLRFRPRAGRII